MFTLSRINIEDFWGNRTVDTDFFDSVNVFIGQNGSGKTTLMNILYGILTVDLQILGDISFKKIDIYLKRKGSNRKISVQIVDTDSRYTMVKYKVGKFVWAFPLFPREVDIRNRRVHPKHLTTISACRQEIQELISVGWLSVHREILSNENEYDDYPRKSQKFRSSVDTRIDNLIGRLSDYYVKIEFEVNRLVKKYQIDVLAGLLYNSSFDTFSLDKIGEINADTIKDDLIHAYSDLNAMTPKMEKKIDNHTNVILKSLENLNKSKKDNVGLILNDILPLVLSRRTNHMIELSKKLENEKAILFEPIMKYIEQLSEFIENKKIELLPGDFHPLRITKDNKVLKIEDLSSGEKQLFILLTETLLQNNAEYLFIADEPELSLHISWQKKLIGSIRELNKNAQIIVATHSPEIAALWGNNIIKMENIIE